MKIYIAGRYRDRLELAEKAFQLLADGHAVTSRWLLGNHPYGANPKEAAHDLADVKACEALVLFTDEDTKDTGGRYCEFGAALAWGKTTYVVGTDKTLFCTLADGHFNTWDECRLALWNIRWDR